MVINIPDEDLKTGVGVSRLWEWPAIVKNSAFDRGRWGGGGRTWGCWPNRRGFSNPHLLHHRAEFGELQRPLHPTAARVCRGRRGQRNNDHFFGQVVYENRDQFPALLWV